MISFLTFFVIFSGIPRPRLDILRWASATECVEMCKQIQELCMDGQVEQEADRQVCMIANPLYDRELGLHEGKLATS